MRWHNLLGVLLLSLLLYGQNPRGQTYQTAELSGLVSDLFGQPLAGVSIEVTSEKLNKAFYDTTDEKGRYRLKGIQPGRYTVVASYRGFRQERKIVSLTSSEMLTLNIGLEAGALHDPFPIQVEGVVTSSSKLQLEGINITIVNAFNQRLSAETITNAQGEYRLFVDNPGLYIIYATGPEYEAAVTTVTLVASLPRINRTIDFTLKKTR